VDRGPAAARLDVQSSVDLNDTLDIFDAPARDQLMLLRQLRAIRDDIDAAAGSAVVFVFHTPSETERLYPELSAGHTGPAATGEPAPRLHAAPRGSPTTGQDGHLRERPRRW